jgi:hypothetical protein
MLVAAGRTLDSVKANGTSSGEVMKMVYYMNISKLVAPPLPDGYWGNVCVPVYVALTAGELVAQPLAAANALIKKSKRDVDDEYVRSYVDFQELHRADGVTAGDVSAFTDWRLLGHGPTVKWTSDGAGPTSCCRCRGGSSGAPNRASSFPTAPTTRGEGMGSRCSSLCRARHCRASERKWQSCCGSSIRVQRENCELVTDTALVNRTENSRASYLDVLEEGLLFG